MVSCGLGGPYCYKWLLLVALDVLTLIVLVSLLCCSSIQLVVFGHLSLLLGLVSCLADLLLILRASGFSGRPIVLFFALC